MPWGTLGTWHADNCCLVRLLTTYCYHLLDAARKEISSSTVLPYPSALYDYICQYFFFFM